MSQLVGTRARHTVLTFYNRFSGFPLTEGLQLKLLNALTHHVNTVMAVLKCELESFMPQFMWPADKPGDTFKLSGGFDLQKYPSSRSALRLKEGLEGLDHQFLMAARAPSNGLFTPEELNDLSIETVRLFGFLEQYAAVRNGVAPPVRENRCRISHILSSLSYALGDTSHQFSRDFDPYQMVHADPLSIALLATLVFDGKTPIDVFRKDEGIYIRCKDVEEKVGFYLGSV